MILDPKKHDPLCPMSWPTGYNDPPKVCVCNFIVRARADEREKAAQRVEALSSSPSKEKVQGLTYVTKAAAAARGEEQ